MPVSICPQCNQKLPAGATVCPHHGAPITSAGGRRGFVDRVGEYDVKGVIGEGGMGWVYEGVQPVIGKRVAIKVLKKNFAEDPEEAQRLVSEARSVNQIGHRGIIDIFSFGTLPDGRQYFVMEYMVGVPLSQHLKQHAPLLAEDVLQIVDEVASALAAAHNAGVIHRDLKPSNVFLVSSPDGSSYVKLLDFGLAKQAQFARGETEQTRVSRVIGTPEFMAPEQARAEPVGPRTDLYALGVVAYEMLTGRLPFTAPTVFEIVNMHLNEPPVPPSKHEPSIPREVEELVMALLEKVPGNRPPSAELVRQQIKRIRKGLRMNATRLASPVVPLESTPRLPLAPSAPSDSDFTWTPAHRGGNRGADLSKIRAELNGSSNIIVEEPELQVPRDPYETKPSPVSEALRLSGPASTLTDDEVYTAPTRTLDPREFTEAKDPSSGEVPPSAPPLARPRAPSLPEAPAARPGGFRARLKGGDPRDPITLTGEARAPKIAMGTLALCLVLGVGAWAFWRARGASTEPAGQPPAEVVAAVARASPPPQPALSPVVPPPPPTQPDPVVAAKGPEPVLPPVEPDKVPDAPKSAEAPQVEPPKAKASAQAGRYRRVKAAWAKARPTRSADDVRIFDLMLASIGPQVGKVSEPKLKEQLDDFVGSALMGVEP